MQPADIVRELRGETGLSIRALAAAAGVAASTVHRIERSELQPTVELLRRIVEAAGARLHVEPHLDYTASAVGLARSIAQDLDRAAESAPVRKAAEFAHRFRSADDVTRVRMMAAEPPPTGDDRWDAFVAALVEWLAVQTDVEVPSWARQPGRYLHVGWWVSPMRSLQAWEYAGAPASFKTRGIYLHRDSLTNV